MSLIVFVVCEGDRRFCNEFWKGKLKELVILCQVLEKEKEQLLQPRVQIFDKVTLEYICTEDRAEYILGNLIKAEQFSSNGKYHDNMITENFMNEERTDASFDIIKGQLESCNIAAMGIGKLKEVFDKSSPESMKDKWNKIIYELWEE